MPEHIDIKNTKSLGMQLVHSLTDQLDGKIECNNKNGTQFKIEFKYAPEKDEEKQALGVEMVSC